MTTNTTVPTAADPDLDPIVDPTAAVPLTDQQKAYQAQETLKQASQAAKDALKMPAGVWDQDKFAEITAHLRKPAEEAGQKSLEQITASMRARGMVDSTRHGDYLLQQQASNQASISQNIDVPLILEQMRQRDTATRQTIQQAADIGSQEWAAYMAQQNQDFGQGIAEANLMGYYKDNPTMQKIVTDLQVSNAALQRALSSGEATGTFVDPDTGESYQTLKAQQQKFQQQLDVAGLVGNFQGQMTIAQQQQKVTDLNAAMDRAIAAGQQTGQYVDPQTGQSYKTLAYQSQLFQQQLSSDQLVISQAELTIAQQQYTLAETNAALDRAIAQGTATGVFKDPLTGKTQATLEAEQQAFQQTLDTKKLELEQERVNQVATQFGQQMGLSRDQFNEAVLEYNLGRTDSLKQFADTHGLDTTQLQAQIDQFNVTSNFEQQRINAQSSQFADQLGLSRDQFNEAVLEYNLGRKDSLSQFADTHGLDAAQLQAQIDQFNVTSSQEQQRINAQSAQFGQQLGLSRDQFDEAVLEHRLGRTDQLSQFADTHGLDVAQLEAQIDQFTVASEQDQQKIDAQKSQFADQFGLSNEQFDEAVLEYRLGREDSLRQFADTHQLDRDQLNQRIAEFNTASGQDQQKIDAQKSQFADQFGLSNAQFDEAVLEYNLGREDSLRQFASTNQLDRDQLNQRIAEFNDTIDIQKRQTTIAEANSDMDRAVAHGEQTGNYVDPVTKKTYETLKAQSQTHQQGLADKQHLLEQQKLQQSANQFGQTFGLSSEQFREAVRQYDLNRTDGLLQFADTHGLNVEELKEKVNQWNTENDFREQDQKLASTNSAMDRAIAQGQATGNFIDPVFKQSFETLAKKAFEQQTLIDNRQISVVEARQELDKTNSAMDRAILHGQQTGEYIDPDSKKSYQTLASLAATFQENITAAQLTGTYLGEETLAERQVAVQEAQHAMAELTEAIDRAVAQGQMTGVFVDPDTQKPIQTLAAAQQEAQIRLQEAQLTGSYKNVFDEIVQTLASKQQDIDRRLSEAGLTGVLEALSLAELGLTPGATTAQQISQDPAILQRMATLLGRKPTAADIQKFATTGVIQKTTLSAQQLTLQETNDALTRTLDTAKLTGSLTVTDPNSPYFGQDIRTIESQKQTSDEAFAKAGLTGIYDAMTLTALGITGRGAAAVREINASPAILSQMASILGRAATAEEINAFAQTGVLQAKTLNAQGMALQETNDAVTRAIQEASQTGRFTVTDQTSQYFGQSVKTLQNIQSQIAEAAITGKYNESATLDAMIQKAKLTGKYDDEETLAYKQQEIDKRVSEAGLSGYMVSDVSANSLGIELGSYTTDQERWDAVHAAAPYLSGVQVNQVIYGNTVRAQIRTLNAQQLSLQQTNDALTRALETAKLTGELTITDPTSPHYGEDIATLESKKQASDEAFAKAGLTGVYDAMTLTTLGVTERGAAAVARINASPDILSQMAAMLGHDATAEEIQSFAQTGVLQAQTLNALGLELQQMNDKVTRALQEASQTGSYTVTDPASEFYGENVQTLQKIQSNLAEAAVSGEYGEEMTLEKMIQMAQLTGSVIDPTTKLPIPTLQKIQSELAEASATGIYKDSPTLEAAIQNAQITGWWTDPSTGETVPVQTLEKLRDDLTGEYQRAERTGLFRGDPTLQATMAKWSQESQDKAVFGFDKTVTNADGTKSLVLGPDGKPIHVYGTNEIQQVLLKDQQRFESMSASGYDYIDDNGVERHVKGTEETFEDARVWQERTRVGYDEPVMGADGKTPQEDAEGNIIMRHIEGTQEASSRLQARELELRDKGMDNEAARSQAVLEQQKQQYEGYSTMRTFTADDLGLNQDALHLTLVEAGVLNPDGSLKPDSYDNFYKWAAKPQNGQVYERMTAFLGGNPPTLDEMRAILSGGSVAMRDKDGNPRVDFINGTVGLEKERLDATATLQKAGFTQETAERVAQENYEAKVSAGYWTTTKDQAGHDVKTYVRGTQSQQAEIMRLQSEYAIDEDEARAKLADQSRTGYSTLIEVPPGSKIWKEIKIKGTQEFASSEADLERQLSERLQASGFTQQSAERIATEQYAQTVRTGGWKMVARPVTLADVGIVAAPGTTGAYSMMNTTAVRNAITAALGRTPTSAELTAFSKTGTIKGKEVSMWVGGTEDFDKSTQATANALVEKGWTAEAALQRSRIAADTAAQFGGWRETIGPDGTPTRTYVKGTLDFAASQAGLERQLSKDLQANGFDQQTAERMATEQYATGARTGAWRDIARPFTLADVGITAAKGPDAFFVMADDAVRAAITEKLGYTPTNAQLTEFANTGTITGLPVSVWVGGTEDFESAQTLLQREFIEKGWSHDDAVRAAEYVQSQATENLTYLQQNYIDNRMWYYENTEGMTKAEASDAAMRDWEGDGTKENPGAQASFGNQMQVVLKQMEIDAADSLLDSQAKLDRLNALVAAGATIGGNALSWLFKEGKGGSTLATQLATLAAAGNAITGADVLRIASDLGLTGPDGTPMTAADAAAFAAAVGKPGGLPLSTSPVARATRWVTGGLTTVGGWASGGALTGTAAMLGGAVVVAALAYGTYRIWNWYKSGAKKDKSNREAFDSYVGNLPDSDYEFLKQTLFADDVYLEWSDRDDVFKRLESALQKDDPAAWLVSDAGNGRQLGTGDDHSKALSKAALALFNFKPTNSIVQISAAVRDLDDRDVFELEDLRQMTVLDQGKLVEIWRQLPKGARTNDVPDYVSGDPNAAQLQGMMEDVATYKYGMGIMSTIEASEARTRLIDAGSLSKMEKDLSLAERDLINQLAMQASADPSLTLAQKQDAIRSADYGAPEPPGTADTTTLSDGIQAAWNTATGEAGYKAEFDLNHDGVINTQDLSLVDLKPVASVTMNDLTTLGWSAPALQTSWSGFSDENKRVVFGNIRAAYASLGARPPSDAEITGLFGVTAPPPAAAGDPPPADNGAPPPADDGDPPPATGKAATDFTVADLPTSWNIPLLQTSWHTFDDTTKQGVFTGIRGAYADKGYAIPTDAQIATLLGVAAPPAATATTGTWQAARDAFMQPTATTTAFTAANIAPTKAAIADGSLMWSDVNTFKLSAAQKAELMAGAPITSLGLPSNVTQLMKTGIIERMDDSGAGNWVFRYATGKQVIATVPKTVYTAVTTLGGS